MIRMTRLKERHRQIGPKARIALIPILTALLLGGPMTVSLVDSNASAAINKSGQKALQDQAITDAVEDELMYDPAVPHADITVQTISGVTRLQGSTPDLLSKERAARIAETVKGVRSVVNEIKVLPLVERSDEVLRQDIEEALLLDPATESYEVRVAVARGVAALTGSVDSWQEKLLAESVTKGVLGVKDVVNQLTIELTDARPDAEIAPEVKTLLRRDVLVDDGMINVTVTDGVVRLMGTVGSAAEKSRAIRDARVRGVKGIDASKLEVAEWARKPQLRADKYVKKSDEEIRIAVEDAMLFDPRVNSVNVKTVVDDGVVTLRGEVGSLRAKRAASQDARYTVGVTRIDNRLKLKPAERVKDEAIQSAIRKALKRDPFTTSSEIDVDVKRGVVTLEGTVDSNYEKSRADYLSSLPGGVVAVINDLGIKRPSRSVFIHDPYVFDGMFLLDDDWRDYSPSFTLKSDAEIREDIRSEYLWSPFVDVEKVNVAVDDGVATLTGTVESWTERLAAVDNAYEGGAVWVDDELVVEKGGGS